MHMAYCACASWQGRSAWCLVQSTRECCDAAACFGLDLGAPTLHPGRVWHVRRLCRFCRAGRLRGASRRVA